MSRIYISAAISCLALLPIHDANAQYKYTAPDGTTVYSDQPPPSDARNVRPVSLGSGASSIDVSRMPFELRRAHETYPVTLYTTNNCAPCDQGKALLQGRGIPFSEKTVNTAEDILAMKAQGLGDRLPVLAVGSNRVANFQESAWTVALDAAAYPKTPALPGTFTNPAATALAPKSPETPKASAATTRNENASPPPASADNPAGIRF
jgi:glutaredoxin